MSRELRLIANLGSEEAGAGRMAVVRPGSEVAMVAELWRGLFNPPAFPWLREIEAAAWLNDDAAERAAGARTLFGASAGTVRRVHDKAWAISVAKKEKLEARVFHGLPIPLAPEELRGSGAAARVSEVLAGWPPWARARFTLKPRLGTSGRGRVSGVDGLVNEAMQRAFERLATHGGAVLEPWLDRVADASAQIYVGKDGAVKVLGTLSIVTTGSGQPRGHRGECDFHGDVSSGIDEDEALRAVADLVGAHAAGAGYYGPCGIDGFAYRSPEDGGRSFRSLVEFNARFTAGTVALGHIALNMGGVRTSLRLERNELCHFYVGRCGLGPALASKGGVVRVPLLSESGLSADTPVLLVARERVMIDEWLRLSQKSV